MIVVSAIATVYAFAWDVMMDWGLSRSDLHVMFSSCRGKPVASCGLGKRALLPRTYAMCVAIDLVARLSWVNTLMPVEGWLTDDVVLREVLKTSLAITEIARRSMWAVLRIEWEQVANAGGFRALLWVPDRLTTELTPLEFGALGATISDPRECLQTMRMGSRLLEPEPASR